ncbi:MAG: hypothetical protein KGJ88_08695 [Verrucomicrobiota bacterium]|nr:hypothetical protein [Verrucomicrobiota bacterium]
MKNILSKHFGRGRRLTKVLGLSLDGARLAGVVLRRGNGRLGLEQAFSVTLSLDPLTAEAELTGREIRNHLDAAGIHERHCVMGLPLKWMLTAHAELPLLPEADAASLLRLEAERAFPCDVSGLQLGQSLCALPDGKQYATLAGIPTGQIGTMEKALAAAKLKPVSFSPALMALQPPGRAGLDEPVGATTDGVLALLVGETHVSLQITRGGGVAALRALEGAIENQGGRRALDADAVAREIRITVGQLPASLRQSVRRIRVFGPRDMAGQLADEMELRFEPMGLEVEAVTAYRANELGFELPPDAPVSAAFSLAARRLGGLPPAMEFLPARPTAVELLAERYSSGHLRTIGATGAALAAMVAGMFLIQQIEMTRLRSQWAAMAAKVQELSGLQQQIQQCSPWFDASAPDLSVLKQLTLAFPQDGVVTAKSVQIHDGNAVTCSGTADDSAALLRMLTQLRAAPGVRNLQVDGIRGKSPMQFTFEFHWSAP